MTPVCPQCLADVPEHEPMRCGRPFCPYKNRAAVRRSRPLEIIDALAEEPSVRDSEQALAAVLDLKRMMEAA